MKKVVLSGYYGFDNIGDEAVLYSIILSLRELIPDIHITVLSNNPQRTKDLYKVDTVDRWKMKKVYRAIQNSDMLISGGGSLLQDVTGIKSVFYYLFVMGCALWAKKPLFIYSQGIGPLNHLISKKLSSIVLKKAVAITVRDDESKNLLVKIGLDSKKITVTADPVLAMRANELAVNENPKIAVSLRSWQNLPKEDFAWICDYLIKDGYDVTFVPFHYPGDLEVSKEIMAMMKCKVNLLDRTMTPGEMLDYLANFDMLIGMRLHSLIMAGSLGIPFAAISYDPKIDAFTKLAGLKVVSDLSDYDSVDFKQGISEFVSDNKKKKEIMMNNVEILRDKSKISANMVRDILMKQK